MSAKDAILQELIKKGEKAVNYNDNDIFDLLGGSMRSLTKNTGDYDEDISALMSTGASNDLLHRITSKPIRIGLDIKELFTDPKWSLENNKIGLTKDALLIALLGNLLSSDEEENLYNTAGENKN